MRVYVKIIWVTCAISALSFAGAIIFSFTLCGDITNCAYDMCLAIFGSALLSAVTSVATYTYEKRRQMEEFLKCTKSILEQLKKYNLSWNDEKKISFFLKFNEIDFDEWDGYIRDIQFLLDPKHKKRDYIYRKIYEPIEKLTAKVAYMERHFRYHKEMLETNSSTLRDTGAMKKFIREIEGLFIEKITHTEIGSDGQEFVWTEISNKLVHSILLELNGNYYNLMYGRKEENNEQDEI